MTILQKPETINLSGNLVDFIISSSSAVSFVLKQDTRVLFEGNYTPNDNQRIEIDVKDIIEADLKAVFSDSSEPYEQSELVKTYTAEIAEQTHTFTVIKAGVDRLATSAANFLKANWLTWQPQVKKVTYYLPESLTFYSVEASVVKVKAYFQQQDSGYAEETKQLLSIVAGKAYTVPVQYAVIAEKFESRLPAFYDVWFETVDGVRLSYIQRYVSSGMMSEDESWIVFENSLGGFDTFRAYGQHSLTADHDHQLAKIGDITDEYNVDTTREFQKNTGYLVEHERKWLLDFFPSRQKYLYSSNYLRRIVVTEDDTSYTGNELPSSYTFNYRFADAKPYLNLQRVEELPSDLTISIPDLSSFTIPPRLVEFPSQNLTEGVMFPVQNPYSESWATTTIGAILSYIMNKIIELGGDGTGGVGHTHANFDVLKALEYVDEYLTYNGKKIKAGYADEAGRISEENDVYIHKDRVDQTNFLLKFGEFIDSMIAGKGTGIFPDGRIQTRKLEVSGSMIVMELIINEISAMMGDFSFSDCGYIEKVEFVSANTYKLYIRKNTEFDFTTLDENDILYSIVNNLKTGGTDYYTSWMRVLTKNVNDNTLTIVLYPDEEVPGGKNYPPVAGYNLTRRGNSVLPDEGQINERAQSWLLSSREGRIMFLANVYKPILEDYNYAISIGKFPQVEAIANLPISDTDMGIMAKTIVCEQLYQYDYNGDVIPNKVDRGEWSLAVAQSEQPYRFIQHDRLYPDGHHTYTELEQHTVYHYGCKWGCLVDKTQDEPVWNSPSWSLIEGDKNYHLDFESSNGWQFFVQQVNTDIKAVVNYGNRDITNTLMATTGVEVEWLRDTGDVPSDNSWKPTYVDGQKHVIHLSVADMGSGWGSEYRKISFICRVFIPVGEGYDKVENSINIKI